MVLHPLTKMELMFLNLLFHICSMTLTNASLKPSKPLDTIK